jgi:hypothetical protein
MDRANNALGYTMKNCVACCTECNQMKGKHMTHAEMEAAMDIRLPVEAKMFINQLPIWPTCLMISFIGSLLLSRSFHAKVGA